MNTLFALKNEASKPEQRLDTPIRRILDFFETVGLLVNRLLAWNAVKLAEKHL